MKLRTRFLLGLGVGSLLLISTLRVALSSKVYAEAPRCFMHSNVGDAAFHYVNCSDTSNSALISALTGAPPQDDQCYDIGELSVNKQAASTPTCQKWIADAGATAAVPPNCVAIDGSMSDWNAGKIRDLNLYHPNAKCADFIDRIKASGYVVDQSTFQNGQCYMLFKESDTKYTYMQRECKEGLQELLTHQQMPTQSLAVADSNRDQVINCNKTVDKCFAENPLIGTINMFITFFSIGLGVIVVIMIMVGGIQYISAGNNPQTVAAGKKKITNALIALVAFLLIYAFSQWLIPGGPF